MTAPRPRRLTHANLFVADMERSMDFYMSVIGLDESYRRTNLRAGFLTNGNSHHDIAVMEYGQIYAGKRERARKTGLNHLAFEMENDLELNRWYRAAVEAGAHIHRTVDHGNTHSCYMHDPDGIQIEVYCDTVREWWHLKTGTMTTPLDDWTPGEGEHSTEPMYLENPKIGRMEDAPLHPVKTTHAVLVAENFETCFDFYTRIIGLSAHSGGRDGRFCVLAGGLGTPCLALFRANAQLAPGFHHVALSAWSVDNLTASRAALAEAGIEIEAETDHPSRYALCVTDPDGFRVQLYADRPGGAGIDWAAEDVDTLLYLV